MNEVFKFLHQIKTQAVVAYVIMIGGGLMILFGHLTEGVNNRILDIILLTATFYFGGSKTSASKDETINTMAKTQQSTIQNTDNNSNQ